MEVQELLRSRRDAPTFIAAYELRQRSANAQLLLADAKRDADAEAARILYRWVENNLAWIRLNQDKYHRCQKLVRFTEEQLLELNQST